MGLPLFELGFPGTPLRTQLVAAVLDGSKTTTTALLGGYEVTDEPLPTVGDRLALADDDDTPVAVVEILEVRIVPISEVDLQHAVDEGEGDESVAQWRLGHTRFFESDEVREELGDPTFTVDDTTLVVLQRFCVVPD